MLIYELYKTFIKEGYNELFDYFSFIFFSFLSLPIEIIISPFTIITLLMWAIRRDKQND